MPAVIRIVQNVGGIYKMVNHSIFMQLERKTFAKQVFHYILMHLMILDGKIWVNSQTIAKLAYALSHQHFVINSNGLILLR